MPDRNAVEPVAAAPVAFASLLVDREPVALQAEPLQPERIEIPVQPAAPAAGTVPVPLPDFTFDPPPATPAPEVLDNRLMFGALGNLASTPLSLHDDREAALVFAASSAPAPEVPQWDLAPFHPDADPAASAEDERSPTFASFDPVSFERAETGMESVPQWTLSEATPPVSADVAVADVEHDVDASVPFDTTGFAAPVFDPVAAEHDVVAARDDVVFRFDADALDNADDVLSLHAMETLSLDDDAGLHPSLETVDDATAQPLDESPVGAEVDAVAADVPEHAAAPMAEVLTPASDAPAPAVSVIDIDTIAPIDFSEADAQFFAELSAAAADFNPQAMAAPPAADIPVVAGTEAGFEAGFDDDAENIDEDIREVFWKSSTTNWPTLARCCRHGARSWTTWTGCGRSAASSTPSRAVADWSARAPWGVRPKIEGMLNRVLDGSRPATPAVLAMVDNAHAALPQLNAALRHGQRISVDLQAMQAIADRVGAGEETFYVPLPAAAAPAATLAESEGEDEISRLLDAEAAASAQADASAVAEDAGTPANIDSVLREILEAEVEVHRDPAGVAALGTAGTAAGQRRTAACGSHHERRLRDDRSAGNHRRYRRRRVLHQAGSGRRCGTWRRGCRRAGRSCAGDHRDHGGAAGRTPAHCAAGCAGAAAAGIGWRAAGSALAAVRVGRRG